MASLILGGILFLALRDRPAPRRSLFRRSDLPLFALAGAIGYSLSIIGQFSGTYLSTAANGALVTSAAPAFIVLFAGVNFFLGGFLILCGVLVVSRPAG
ncbi:MAG: hypothetical protein HY326_07625 [Chloroflexi bacterium]|nr:hypothetical protein [Chloroflexota bacterium]